MVFAAIIPAAPAPKITYCICLHLLYPDCLFWTCLNAAWLTAAVLAEITLYDPALSGAVRLQDAKGTVHHTHETAGTASFVILHNPCFRIFA